MIEQKYDFVLDRLFFLLYKKNDSQCNLVDVTNDNDDNRWIHNFKYTIRGNDKSPSETFAVL